MSSSSANVLAKLFTKPLAQPLAKQFYIEPVAAYHEERPKNDASLIYLNCPESVLIEFKKLMVDTPILGATYKNPYTLEQETIPSDVSLLTGRHLQILARTEAVNVNGVMNSKLYNGLLSDDKISRLRCLVKATNVTGSVFATHTGGYRHKRYEFETPVKNILIDQAGLQWQGDFRNTGGMHFYPENPEDDSLPTNYSAWQNEMYQAMYGVRRAPQSSANSLAVSWYGLPGLLDLDSVSNALAVEFSQALDAAVHQANIDLDDKQLVNFRFCRAGMGFFVSGLSCDLHALRVARLEGLEMALQKIVSLPKEMQALRLGKIGRIVLPHSNEAPYSDDVLERIGLLVEELGLEWGGAPEEDTFKPVKGYVNATTNCADPHAMPGNEGGPCSVDACVAYNANINNHYATYNKDMQVRVSAQFDFRVIASPSTLLSDIDSTQPKRLNGSGFFRLDEHKKQEESSDDKLTKTQQEESSPNII